jgi:hypothetical protein
MVLEGGYNPEALAISIRNSSLALADRELPEHYNFEPNVVEPEIDDLIAKLQVVHSV